MKLPKCVMPVVKRNSLKESITPVFFNGEEVNIVRQKKRYFLYPLRCPHRGTHLRHAEIKGEEVVCPYHGWRIQTTGETIHPKLNKSVCRVKLVELKQHLGFLWFVPKDMDIDLAADVDQIFCGSLEFKLSAPFHVVLDNFNEGSHTPFVHRFMGPKIKDIPKVKFSWSDNGDHTSIEYDGPQKRNFIFRFMAPFQKVGWFINWKTSYSPPLMQYDSKWYLKRNKKTIFTNRNYYYILPDGEDQTKLFAFIYNSTPGLLRFFPIIIKLMGVVMTWNQVMEDEVFYPKIADLPSDFNGLNLDEDDQAVKHIRNEINLDQL